MDVAGLGPREPDIFGSRSDSFVPESALSRSWRRTEEGYAPHLRLGVSGTTHLDDWHWDFFGR